jgi:hypothetical protein
MHRRRRPAQLLATVASGGESRLTVGSKSANCQLFLQFFPLALLDDDPRASNAVE